MLLALVAFVTGAAGVCAWTWMIVVRLNRSDLGTALD
jgi:hypothetical protein